MFWNQTFWNLTFWNLTFCGCTGQTAAYSGHFRHADILEIPCVSAALYLSNSLYSEYSMSVCSSLPVKQPNILDISGASAALYLSNNLLSWIFQACLQLSTSQTADYPGYFRRVCSSLPVKQLTILDIPPVFRNITDLLPLFLRYFVNK
jgi:hypothetical protein